MEMQVQSDSRIFLPGCAARRRIAGPCAPAGRRGAGTGLAVATGHVPPASAQPPPRPPPPLPSPARHSAPPPNPNSHQEEGAAPPPRPGRGGLRGRLLATARAAPAGHLPRGSALGPHRAGDTGRGSTDGSRRCSRCSRRLGPGGVKGLLRSAISISLKGPVPPGPRVAICISIGGSRRGAGAPSPSAAPRDVNPPRRGAWPPSAGQGQAPTPDSPGSGRLGPRVGSGAPTGGKRLAGSFGHCS